MSLKFSDITTLVVMEENMQVLVVEGVMENIAPVSVRLPVLTTDLL